MTDTRPYGVALAGQQNCGKSTIFNILTGLQQHIANYPGVTVDKKSGAYMFEERRYQVTDLPGAYSLSAFSPEERVSRQVLLEDPPDVVVNVIDATNLRRSLPLTFQLMEMGFRVVVALNMMDAAARRGLEIDLPALSRRLNAPVVPMVGRAGKGGQDLRDAIAEAAQGPQAVPATLNYGPLEDDVAALHARLAAIPGLDGRMARWHAVKLLEDDAEAIGRAGRLGQTDLLQDAEGMRARFERVEGLSAGDHISATRDRHAAEILRDCVTDTRHGMISVSERIDRVLLNRVFAPLFLMATIWVIYQLSIVQGYELTKVTWPVLAGLRNMAASVLPDAGFLVDPQIRSLGLWIVDSINTLLNYVPIFLILFALIAILEDSGYMARIAFILDRILHRFGLHGQSTLPFILGGVFAGGCAVPGVMATKGIPDARARLATILTVPFMNCMAKIPLYTLLINIYFPDAKGLMLFYLSTITVLAALLVAKLLTSSVLAAQPTAPFVMELPSYHMPTVTGVARRAVDRTWMYIKKVGTVVVAIAVVIFVLLQFPGVPSERMAEYQSRGEAAIAEFYATLEGSPHLAAVDTPDELIALINVHSTYKARRLNAASRAAAEALDQGVRDDHPNVAPFVLRSRADADRTAFAAMRDLANARNTLRREMQSERIESSFLGHVGRGLEPVTQFADFDWRINIALLASFAARESSVATLGVLFDQEEGENRALEDRMGDQQRAEGRTALSAVALMLFFALYPPCLATVIMVRVQTQSTGWMTFSIIFPTILGLVVASAVFQGASALDLSGLEAMTAVWLGTFALLLLVALPKPWLPDLRRRGTPDIEDVAP
ncbi:Ferrous iron transport protein B [Roseibacterium elongatum DSM 19469]|uniref:Ferrous iron transport protein B n=1 Tax=Roseicyclus elongatus DSM 19469 TaxID=1294273 RepID=W8S8I6_9RHOB|nr:ferrous iron transport protein B [Roseibacterium elongatum]AHM05291.1 Ferrous iron transport protein B [Roseibacterium elongatum DSM 19469]